MLEDSVILSCTHMHTHARTLNNYGFAFSPDKLTFKSFHGNQNKEFLYWQHSHSKTPCTLFYFNVEGTFLTKEQVPTASHKSPNVSMP